MTQTAEKHFFAASAVPAGSIEDAAIWVEDRKEIIKQGLVFVGAGLSILRAMAYRRRFQALESEVEHLKRKRG